MATTANAAADTTLSADRKARSAFSRGMSEGVEKVKKETAAKIRGIYADLEQSEMTGEVVAVIGGAGAGFIARQGWEMEWGDPDPQTGEKMAITMAAPIGVGAYVAGRYLKQPLLRKLGLGLTIGAVAVTVKDLDF